jgi:ferredoxin
MAARYTARIVLNAELSKAWPVITTRIDPPADAAEWDKVANKLSELQR